MTNPYLKKTGALKSRKKGCLIGCAIVLGIVLLTVFILLYFGKIHRYKMCTAEVGGDTVAVYRIGWTGFDAAATFEVRLNKTPLLEFHCVEDIMCSPHTTIETINDCTVRITGSNDSYDTVIRLELQGDTQNAVWWLAERGESSYNEKLNQSYDDSVRAIASSLNLSHRKPGNNEL